MNPSVVEGLPRNPIEHPSQAEAHSYKFSEYFKAVEEPFTPSLATHNPEDQSHESSEYDHQQKVLQDFLPAPMSNASRARIKFSSPAAIKKTLPYSEVASAGCSFIAKPDILENRYRRPDPALQKPKRIERRPSPESWKV